MCPTAVPISCAVIVRKAESACGAAAAQPTPPFSGIGITERDDAPPATSDRFGCDPGTITGMEGAISAERLALERLDATEADGEADAIRLGAHT